MPTKRKNFIETSVDDPKIKQDVFVDGDPALDLNSGGKAGTQTRNDMKPEKVAYLKEMILELKKLSDEIEEPMASYLLEMAYMEVDTVQSVREFSDDLDSA